MNMDVLQGTPRPPTERCREAHRSQKSIVLISAPDVWSSAPVSAGVSRSTICMTSFALSAAVIAPLNAGFNILMKFEMPS